MIKIIKEDEMKRHAACMRERRNGYKIVVENLKEIDHWRTEA
jgi:hypothetical protein